MDLKYPKPNTFVSKDINMYATGAFKQTEGLDGKERRRSILHDNFDASFDHMPAKRKLPLNTNNRSRPNFNITTLETNYDNVMVGRHMNFFSPKTQRVQPNDNVLECHKAEKSDPRNIKNLFV